MPLIGQTGGGGDFHFPHTQSHKTISNQNNKGFEHQISIL